MPSELRKRMRAAFDRNQRCREEMRRLMAERQIILKEYVATVEDAAWFWTMAARDMGLPADLEKDPGESPS
jgi:hypothetical protein